MLTETPTRRPSAAHDVLRAASSLLWLMPVASTPWCLAQTAISTPYSAQTSAISHPPQQAKVTYADGSLTVVANNTSLNQIVRDIAQQTGMKVTGRVSEDRVFGTYGPDSPSAVLTALLDGSGSNVLLVQNASHAPVELILTRRVGGPTPPDPSAQYANDNSPEPSPPTAPAIGSYSLPVPQPSSNSRSPYRGGTGGIATNPAATAPSSASQEIVFPPIDANTPPSTATTTPTTPDGGSTTVKTPQQIFEQLQKLRQQQAQQPQTQPQ